MKNVIRALCTLIGRYGLSVTEKDGTPQLHWSLYTQGSGVAFDAVLSDFRPALKLMFAEGQLAEAALAKGLLVADEIKVAVRQDSSRYCHAYTMDVEIEGPTSDVDDTAISAVASLKDAVETLRERASIAAHDLLQDYDLLQVQDTELWCFKTERFKVVVTAEADRYGESPGDLELVGMAGDDALEFMQQATAQHHEYIACHFQATVYTRLEGDDEDWFVAGSSFMLGGVYQRNKVLSYVRQSGLIHEAVTEARDSLESSNQLKEAA